MLLGDGDYIVTGKDSIMDQRLLEAVNSIQSDVSSLHYSLMENDGLLTEILEELRGISKKWIV